MRSSTSGHASRAESRRRSGELRIGGERRLGKVAVLLISSTLDPRPSTLPNYDRCGDAFDNIQKFLAKSLDRRIRDIYDCRPAWRYSETNNEFVKRTRSGIDSLAGRPRKLFTQVRLCSLTIWQQRVVASVKYFTTLGVIFVVTPVERVSIDVFRVLARSGWSSLSVFWR